MTVYFKRPQQGYSSGTLTENKNGNQFEVLLSNGKNILLYEHEFDRVNSKLIYPNLKKPLCGNSSQR